MAWITIKMKSCCICQFTVRNPRNIFTESIGQPAIIISDLVQAITNGTDFELDDDSTICKKCCEKLLRYHKSVEIANRLRNEILELIRSPYVIQEFKNALSKNGIQDDVENSFKDYECNRSLINDDSCIQDDEILKEDIPQLEFQLVDLDIKPDLIIEADEVLEETNPNNFVENHDNRDDDDNDDKDLSDIQFLVVTDEEESEDQTENSQQNSEIKCPNCDESFENRRKYNAHVKREHFPGYVCDQCGKTLQSYSGFIGHLQNHQPVKQYECPECGERFNQKVRLKYHMAWHSGETPFQCDICSKRFVHNNGLYRHKQIHNSDLKRLECQVCRFKFRTKAHLDRHMRTHTGAKPFICPVCQKTFAQRYNMKKHLRAHEQPACKSAQ